MNLNKFLGVGNLTRDPEVKEFGDKSVAKFSLAINGWKPKDKDKKPEVMYLDCEAWDSVGKFVSQYGEKGRQLFVEGLLKQDNWEDKDGNKRSKIMLVVKEASFLDNKTRKEDLQTEEVTQKPKEKPREKAVNPF